MSFNTEKEPPILFIDARLHGTMSFAWGCFPDVMWRQVMPLLLGLGICFFASAPSASGQQTEVLGQQAETDQAAPRTRYWARDFSLRDVDSQTAISRLESLGIDVPFQLEGNVSLEATVWIPFGNLLDATKYRFEAALTSPRLTINSVRLADAAIRFEIDEGMLYLRELRGTLLDADSLQPAGVLTGTGSAQLVPLGSLKLTLRLQDLDLQSASRAIAEFAIELQGIAAGRMTFSHPDITETGNLQEWKIEGAVDVEGFAIDSDRLWDLAIESLDVQNGTLRAEGLLAKQRIEEAAEVIGVMQGTANAQLLPAGPVSLDVNLRQVDLRHATESLRLDIPLAGMANGTVHFENPSLERLDDETAWMGTAALRIDRLEYDDYLGADQQLQLRFGKLVLQDGQVALEDFSATQVMTATNQVIAAVRGSASAALFPAGPVQMDLAFNDVALGTLGREFLPDSDLTGTAAGRLRATNPRIDRSDIWEEGTEDLRQWNIEGAVEIEGFAIGSDRSWDLAVESLRVQDGTLHAEGLLAKQQTAGVTEASGVMRGTATMQLVPAGPVSLAANVDQVDLRHAVESLKLDVPLAGVATGTVQIENPSRESLDDETAWMGTAALRIDRLEYDDYPGADQQLQLRFGKLVLQDGEVALEDFSATQVMTATDQVIAAVRGSASAALFPAGPVQMDLAFNDVALGILPPEFFPDIGLNGTAAGSIRATNPQIDRADVLSDWTGTGQLAVNQLTIGSRPVAQLQIPQYTIDPDGIVLSRSAIRGEDWQASAEGEYAWNAPNPFRFQIATPGIPAPELYQWVTGQPAPDETSGAVAFSLNASGQQDPQTWAVEGALEIRQAKLAGIRIVNLQHRLTANAQRFSLVPTGPQRATVSTADAEPPKDALRLGRVESQYELREDAFRVDDFFAEILGGVVEGSASIAFDSASPQQPAVHRAQLQWQGIDYAGTVSIAESNFPVQAMSSGDVRWSVPADRFDDPRAHQFQANVKLSSLTLSEERLGDFTVEMTTDENVWQATVNGTLLGGTAESEMTADIGSVSDWRNLQDADVRGTIAVRTVEMGRLFAFWQAPENVRKWRGLADSQWTFRGLNLGSGSGPEEPPAPPVVATDPVAGSDAAEIISTPDAVSPFRADGMIRVIDVAYEGRRITDRLELHVGYDGNTVGVKQFAGSFAGGRLGASGAWHRTGAAPRLNLLLTGVDISRALLVFSPTLAEKVSGTASGRITLAGQTQLRASGQLNVRDMRLDPFRLGTVRSSVDGAFDLGTQQWRVQFRNIAGTVARGRIRGQANLASSPGQSNRFRLDSRWDLTNVDFEKAIGELSTGRAAPGKGKLSGRLTIKGQRIASVADLEGTLDARLDGTEANAVPGLPAARNQLGVLSLRNTRFDSGAIRGRFRRGTFHLTELWLDSDQLRVWADGNVALSSSRWDINAVVATGNFEQANVTLLALARQVSLDATLPVGLIVRINEALSDRIVHLRLTGPMSRPHVRVQARQTLGENAARFFLRSLTDSLAPFPTPGTRR